jgi:hypothetical protein
MRIVIGLLISMLGGAFQSSTPGDADEVLGQLSKIHLDKKQIYVVRDITIRRDVLTIALNRGTIAFLEPVNGKITGAVFLGSGEIVAIPPDTVEKQQINKFTGTPILNEAFQTAIFRFTDNTFEEIRKEISRHAEEEVSADDVAQFEPWDASLARRSAALNARLMPDFLETPRPLFFAELNGEKRGWFNVAFDTRATEEVTMFQVREIGTTVVADIWASFNQRSEARNLEAVAHENKSPIEILSYEIEGTPGTDNKIDAQLTMHIKARSDGARVLNFDLSPALRVASVVTEMNESVPVYRFSNAGTVSAVLLQPLKRDQELTLRFKYSGELAGTGPWYPSQHQASLPSLKSSFALPNDRSTPMLEYQGHTLVAASYHDEWLFEGLTRYLAALSKEGNDPAAPQFRKLLNDARDRLKPVEGAGAIWLGQRVVSTASPDAYPAVHEKGFWIVHMVRMMLRQDGSNPDAKFLAMLQEFVETFSNKAASTWDFKHVVEKYAGKKLDGFFDQWVLGTGVPVYSADYKISTAGNEFMIEGTINQTGVPEGFAMSVPIYGDDVFLGTVQVGESEGQFRFRVGKKPERLVIDPEMTVLARQEN